MEKLKKVSRAQWCLFALFIGFAFLMQNCQDDDAIIFEENQTDTELNARPASNKVDVCRYNARKGNYSIVSVVAKRVQSGDVIIDFDGDGYVNENLCGFTGNGIDCDDTKAAINSGAVEICDGIDNNCNGEIDEGISKITFYFDNDNDGYGDPTNSISNCSLPIGYVADNTDCDDNYFGINPGVLEICGDGIDNNCDGVIDEGCATSGTYVPDDRFEQALIDLGYDNKLDNYILTENINSITSLNVNNKNISDLTGIEDFINLTHLSCSYNNLIFINVSKNTALTHFECDENPLTSIDVSYNTHLINFGCFDTQLISLDVSFNTSLELLSCGRNQLISLDLSNNTALKYLYCDINKLASLDVRVNTALITLWCNNNPITSLDVSYNTSLTELRCYNNPDLFCIQVNSTQIDNLPSLNWHIDYWAAYSLNCTPE